MRGKSSSSRINRNALSEESLIRFWDKVDKTDSCWNWVAAKDTCGYGYFGLGEYVVKAHRLSFVISRNIDIPDGFNILHTCDNPPCVNPDHLYLGTQKENSIDMFVRGRASNKGSRNPKAAIVENDVILIRELYSLGMRQKDIATVFGVTKYVIHDVVTGRRWTHVKERA